LNVVKYRIFEIFWYILRAEKLNELIRGIKPIKLYIWSTNQIFNYL